MHSRKILTTLLVLLLSASFMFAASAQDLHQDFVAAVQSGDVQGAIDSYENLQERVAKDEEDIQRDIQKAYEKNDRQLYYNAMADLRSLEGYAISQSETDSLLRAIVNSDSDQAGEWAAWLYENSRYYHPRLSFSVDVSSASYSHSYRRSISVAPGSEITLPTTEDLSVNSSAAGVLTGWGITPDEVTYAAGATITMPYTDQTLFAVFTSSVSFSDGEGGEDTVFTDVAEGDVIQIPSPAQNDGAIFEGWYDSSSGQYLSPDETEYTVRGMGASFEALYIKAEATKMTTGHYDVDSVPTGVQIPLTFTLANSGSEDIQGVDITVSSDSGYARLMNTSAYLRTMRAGQDYSLRNVILVIGSDCPAGTVIPLTVTMSDSDGNTFTSTFDLTTR